MYNLTKTQLRRTSVCLTVMLAVGAVTAARADSPDRLMMSVILDGPGAQAVLNGRYEEAISAINRTSPPVNSSDLIAYSTNLCVALVMKSQWDAARVPCNRALDIARDDRHSSVFGRSAAYDQQIAITYSNRAVFNYLDHRTDEAMHDAARAHRLAPDMAFVSRNWVALGNRQTIAGPTVAATGN